MNLNIRTDYQYRIKNKAVCINKYIYLRTVSLLSDDDTENEIYGTSKQHEDNIVA